MITHEKHASEKGFTLIEMAFVFVLSGFLLTAGFQLYSLYTKDRLLNESREKQEQMSTSLSRFSAEESRLPCPADPSLPFDDPNYGEEDCSMMNPAIAVGTCSGPGGTGICKVAGRDTTVDGDTDPDPVLIGAYPFKSLVRVDDQGDTVGMSADDAGFDDAVVMTGLDPWGLLMTYAVTGALTDNATYQSQYGAITVLTEDGVQLTDPDDSAHYVIVAHGANHAGAYNSYGSVPTACDTGIDEGDNCDGDASFVVGLYSTQPGSADYFDDTIWFTSFSMSRLWDFVPGSGDIINLNVGNVGVGTNNPVERLHVVGDFRADEMSLNQICDTTGTLCFPSANLGSTAGTQCPTAPPVASGFMRVVTEINNAQVVCTDIPMLTAIVNQTCNTGIGEYAVGFDSSGTIICEVP